MLQSSSNMRPPAGATPSAWQRVIQANLDELVHVGGIDAACLFSMEGLTLAKAAKSGQALNEMQAVEWIVMMAKMHRVLPKLGVKHPALEVSIESTTGRRWIFRFLTIWGQTAILMLLVPERKTYRGLLSRITKSIEKWSSMSV
jgi:hypothetical protein